jgi:hypothetical protein
MPVLGVRSRRAIAIIALTAIAGCSSSQSRSTVTTTTPSTAPELSLPTAGAQVVMSGLQLDLQTLG